MDAVAGVRKGAATALSGTEALRALVTSEVALDRAVKSVQLNGVVLGGTLALAEWAWPRLVAALAEKMMPHVPEEERALVARAARDAAQTVFSATWFLPMAVLAYVLSAVWWGELAAAVRHTSSSAATTPKKPSRLADEAYRILLLAVLTVESVVVQRIPPWWLGNALALALTSYMCAFYCFDYKWCLEGRSLDSRLAEFERRWAFMLGFGLPLAVVGLALPLLASCVIYSLLFPLCMVQAVVKDPPPPQRSRLRVFWTGHWLLRQILKQTVGASLSSKPSS